MAQNLKNNFGHVLLVKRLDYVCYYQIPKMLKFPVIWDDAVTINAEQQSTDRKPEKATLYSNHTEIKVHFITG